MSVETRIPGALNRGDEILVWCPDWYMRRAFVLGVETFKIGDRLTVCGIAIRWLDDNARGSEEIIYRGAVEGVPTVVKGVQNYKGTASSLRTKENAKARAAKRQAALDNVGDPTPEDEQLASEWEAGK